MVLSVRGIACELLSLQMIWCLLRHMFRCRKNKWSCPGDRK